MYRKGSSHRDASVQTMLPSRPEAFAVLRDILVLRSGMTIAATLCDPNRRQGLGVDTAYALGVTKAATGSVSHVVRFVTLVGGGGYVLLVCFVQCAGGGVRPS